MAKKRLVDFRGGINSKISSHMIGDSQGQDAADTDLSTVRLQGRKKLDTTGTSPLDRAWGEHYYDAGSTGRWVSSDTVHDDDTSAPANLVVTNASDFVTWNQDLYVCRVNASGDDTLIRYIDGGTTPYALAFEPPAKLEVSATFFDEIYTQQDLEADNHTLTSEESLWDYDELRVFSRAIGTNAYPFLFLTKEYGANSYARGVNWAVNRDLTTLADSGYYLKTVRLFNGIPIESNTAIKAELKDGQFVKNRNHTPNLLDFTITAPSDNADSTVSAMTFLGYRLYRNDNISRNVSLGLIKPETGIELTGHAYDYDGDGNTDFWYRLYFTGFDTSGTYRFKWWTYSAQSFAPTTNGTGAIGIFATKSNLEGIEFTPTSGTKETRLLNSSLTEPYANPNKEYTLPPAVCGCDIWIEREVSTDIWATVRCFSFYVNGNGINAGQNNPNYGSTWNNSFSTVHSVQPSSAPFPTNLTPNIGGYDYIDCFASGLSSGYITTNQEKTAPPNSMKFLKEWNNFFFGVGTQYTSSDRYGDNKNKADTFLFVSEYNNPRHWPLDGYLEFPQAITGIFPFRDSLIVFSKFAAYKVFGSRPNQMRKTQFSDTEGLIEGYEKTIQRVGNFLVWISQSGICVFDGAQVTNLTRGRFDGDPFDGTSPIVAGVFEGKYYAIRTNGSGFLIDFTLEGFPITKINSIWDDATVTTPASPVLHYVAKTHQLFFGVLDTNDNTNKGGIVEGSSTRSSWTYKTRAFDGDNFGSIKLIRNFTINGSGYGTLTATVDGTTVLNAVSVGSSGTPITEPTRVYLPETVAGNDFGLPAGDTWDLQLNWTGTVDWIDTEYDILAA